MYCIGGRVAVAGIGDGRRRGNTWRIRDEHSRASKGIGTISNTARRSALCLCQGISLPPKSHHRGGGLAMPSSSGLSALVVNGQAALVAIFLAQGGTLSSEVPSTGRFVRQRCTTGRIEASQ